MGKNLGTEFETQDQLGQARAWHIDRTPPQVEAPPPPEVAQTEGAKTQVPSDLADALAAIRAEYPQGYEPTTPQTLNAVKLIPTADEFLGAHPTVATSLENTALQPGIDLRNRIDAHADIRASTPSPEVRVSEEQIMGSLARRVVHLDQGRNSPPEPEE